MTDSWATSAAAVFGSDLHLDLEDPGLRAGLAEALRTAVRTGRLAAGTRLPSSRSLAADLGVARNTVADSYAELVAEGWLTAQQGSGTRVATRAEPRRIEPAVRRISPSRSTHRLLPGSPNLAEFPRSQWLAASRRALTAAPDDAFGYGDPLGRIELRTALADYLARARGVYAEPERVVVSSGFHHGLTLMARVLRHRRVGSVAVESYGFDVHRDALAATGLRTVPLHVDERGARTEDLTTMRGVGAVLLTPAHQYPTGVELRPERRAAVVNWARVTGGLILEDDYDGEFRYDRQTVGALEGLDPERVVYFGSVSKSLAPGLRLAWMVLPRELVPDVTEAKGFVDSASALEQLTLAEFVSSGAYDRHVRSMRLRYQRRRDHLVATLNQRVPGLQVTGMAAGLQAVIELPPGTERDAVAATAGHGLAVSGLADYRYEADQSERRDALVVGYAAPSESAWAGTLDALCTALSPWG
jgi:GntR family transcriptional regulator/MocR family aminotransferase